MASSVAMFLFSILVFYQVHWKSDVSNPDIAKNSAHSACMPGPNTELGLGLRLS